MLFSVSLQMLTMNLWKKKKTAVEAGGKKTRLVLYHACSIVPSYFTIIPGARVGDEMVDRQLGVYGRVVYNHLISNKRGWKNCFIKSSPKIEKTKVK